MKKTINIILLFLIAAFSVYAQNKPLMAVMPFAARNVSESDAGIVTSLFETGLVKTESFKVIEQNQVKEILEAQAYTLTGCTDESCAVEFGKLLAAEQIILGDFSRLGGQYILNAKLIDVERGENLRADSVSFSNLDDIQEEAELLAFKLAGLTYSRRGAETIATEFGELFIQTDPDNADIFINGIPKGKSPDLFQRVPLGEIIVEARSGNLYARQTVDLEKGIAELSLALKPTFGNMFIKSTISNVEVYVDGESVGPLNNGLFKDLHAGRHQIELIGEGVFWEGEVEILEEESTVVEADPKPYGSLELVLPEGAVASLSGTEAKYQFSSDAGEPARIWAGSYDVQISGPGVEEFTDSIEIKKGETLKYEPELELNEEGRRNLAAQKLKRFSETTEKMQSYNGYIKLRNDIIAFTREMDDQGYSRIAFDARTILLNYSRKELDSQKTRLSSLEEERRSISTSGKTKKGPSIPLLVVSGVCLAATCVTGYLAYDNYSQYQDAQYTDDAITLRKDTQLFQYISIGTGVAAAGTGILSFTLKSSDKRVKELDGEINELKKRIHEIDLTIEQIEKEIA